MDIQHFLNPNDDQLAGWLINTVLWLVVIGIPTILFLLFFLGNLSTAKEGRLLPFAFVFGSAAYLAFVGLVGVGFEFSWLTIALFFVGTAISFGKFSITTNALIDSALAGALIALVGTLAMSGVGFVLVTGFAPHIVGWLIACAAASIIAGAMSYVKG